MHQIHMVAGPSGTSYKESCPDVIHKLTPLTVPGSLYTPWSIKKCATFIFSITLANIDGFS